MQIEVRPIGPLERSVHVRVDANEIESEVEEQIQDVAAKARLPGFRKGRVPSDLIRQRYREGIVGEVRKKTLSDSMDSAFKQEKLSPLHISNFKLLSDPESIELEYLVDITIEPTLKLDVLESLKLARPKVEIVEQDIDNRIEEILDQHREMREAERPIEMGDKVFFTVSDRGTVFKKDDSELDRSEHKELYDIEREYSMFLANQITQIAPWLYFIQEEFLGKSAGDTFEIVREITLDDHVKAVQPGIEDSNRSTKSDENQSVMPSDGEEAIEQDSTAIVEDERHGSDESVEPEFEVYVSKIHIEVAVERAQKVVRPELNSEFFARLEEGVSNEEEFRDKVRESLQSAMDKRADEIVGRQALEQLVSVNPVEMPITVKEELVHSRSAESDNEVNEQSPPPPVTQEQMDQEWKGVIATWIVEQYADANGIEADIAKINEVLKIHHTLRQNFGLNTDELYTDRYVQGIRRNILTEDVLEHVVNRVECEEYSATVQEMNSSDFKNFDITTDLTELEEAPAAWESPVSQNAIDAGRKEVEELVAAATRTPELDHADAQGSATSNSSKSADKGFFRKLFGRFGRKE